MMKQTLAILAGLTVLLVGIGTAMYLTNTTPQVPAISSAEAGSTTKPYVVKLHAQWCPICMVTKGVWAKVQDAYTGQVNLVVFDFTNAETTRASQAEARRLGLGAFFDEYSGATGIVAVVDAKSKDVKGWIQGSRDFAEYRAAIDAALLGNQRP